MNSQRRTVSTLAVFATALVTALSAVGAHAQQLAKVFRVGTLDNSTPSSSGGQRLNVLKAELARLGYVEGTHIVFESRFAEGKMDRHPGFAAELVAMNVDVIVTYGGPPTHPRGAQGHYDNSDRRSAGRRPGRDRRRGDARPARWQYHWSDEP